LREFHSYGYYRLGLIKASILAIVLLISSMATNACQGRATDAIAPTPHDTTGPTFNRITTSSKSFSIECVPTSVTVTANIVDQSGIKRVVFFHRIESEPSYTAVNMNASGDEYSATVKGSDVPGRGWGGWEFYITAEDLAGNESQSTLDRSVEMLLCVSS